MTVAVEPDPAHHAGHALVRVGGAAGASPGFHLRRPPGWEEGNLGPEGWQVADALLQPDASEANGRDLVLRVGPRVCSHVEGGSYLFELPSAGVSEVVAWPDIPYMAPPSAAPPLAVPAKPAPAPVAAPPPLPEAKADKVSADETMVRRPRAPAGPPPLPAGPPALPTVPPPTKATGKSPLPLFLGLLVLLVVVAGGGWWAWKRVQPGQPEAPGPQADATPTPPRPQPLPPEPRPQRPPDLAPPPGPPRTSSPPATPNAPPLSLAGLPVPDVIARAPNAAAIRTEGERRLGGAQKDDGLLLLEAAAARGDAGAMAALARLYDPIGFASGGPIPAPDARQSAKYYRDAARAGEAGVAARRNALRAMLEQRSQSGDLSATLMLRDYWP